jgi:hypothetical protein
MGGLVLRDARLALRARRAPQDEADEVCPVKIAELEQRKTD